MMIAISDKIRSVDQVFVVGHKNLMDALLRQLNATFCKQFN